MKKGFYGINENNHVKKKIDHLLSDSLFFMNQNFIKPNFCPV